VEDIGQLRFNDLHQGPQPSGARCGHLSKHADERPVSSRGCAVSVSWAHELRWPRSAVGGWGNQKTLPFFHRYSVGDGPAPYANRESTRGS
jgi:hypothetical protein